MTESLAWFRRPGVRASALLLAIFTAGVLTGMALDRTLLRRPARVLLLDRPAPPGVEALVERARRRLRLDSLQTARVHALLERRQPLLVDAWSRARVGLIAEVDTTLGGLTAILTPAQQVRLRQLLALRGFVARDQRNSEESNDDVP